MEKKEEQRWLPLEANPEVWNKIVHKLGADSAWNYVDVFGFDPELLAMIPRPTAAIIFLFPLTENYEKFKEEEEARLTKHEQNISPDVLFFKQTISNACGMIALLHSLANNEEEIIGPGLLGDIVDKAKSMSPDERAELLEGCAELAAVHREAAYDGQTAPPSLEEDVDLHFVCFVEVDQHLYELDGRKPFPINHGKSTDLIESAAKVMRHYIERDPDQTNYSAIALASTTH
ncbi:Ubiquitin carboxyl-terminal hydrolase isozyme L3 [Apophysomyces sp. BC1021]|nr:Ubiquitin carboxyl-terminal hydrolase isozyme L3 [Apophysomyces sp. BC1021]